jgi:hypothetical protein
MRFGWWSRLRWVRSLARLRKPLGISAGIWFVAHSVVGTVEYLDLSWGALPGVLRIGDMGIGVLAHRRHATHPGQELEGLERLVWFAVPLAVVHTALSSARLHHLEPPGVLLFGLMVGFAAFERYALAGGGRGVCARRAGRRGSRRRGPYIRWPPGLPSALGPHQRRPAGPTATGHGGSALTN